MLAITSACATVAKGPSALDPVDLSSPSFVAARLLFDRAGQPQGMAYSSVDGRTCFTSSVRVDRGAVVPAGMPCSHRLRGVASHTVGPAFDSAVDGDHWLIASPFTGGAGSELDLRMVRRTASQFEVVADGILEELHWTPAGDVHPMRRDFLRGAVVQSVDPTTRVAKWIIETDAWAEMKQSADFGPVVTMSGLMQCSIQLLAPAVDSYRYEQRVTATVTPIGAGAGAQVISRHGEAWIAARLGEAEPSLDESGYFIAYVGTAEGSWRVQQLPPLRLPSCWSCSCAASGELLVTSIVTTQPGAHVLRKARLHPFRDSAWRLDTMPLGEQAVNPDRVSWQRAPDAFPVPWMVDEQGRGFVLR